MAVDLGVHIFETATSVQTPNTATVGVPYVVGASPVHLAETPVAAKTPGLVTSWSEAVKKFGYSDDWKTYPLCEFMYSHFKLFCCEPAVLYNAAPRETQTTTLTPEDHTATLPEDAIAGNLTITTDVTNEETSETETVTLVENTDYTVERGDDDILTIELLEDGSAYDATSLSVTYDALAVDSMTQTDVAEGVSAVDECMTVCGIVPDLLLAPGWSGNNVIAAVMAAKAGGNICGLFSGKALIDIPCDADGVTEYSQLSGYKNDNNLVDENQILCWPQVKLGDLQFHLSTQLAGRMAQTDTDRNNLPYESPSNKNLQMDSCCLEDGTEVRLTWPQVNLIAGSWGVVTALNFMDTGWIDKGNYCACYPGNTDVKDQFIPVSRMFDYIGNTLIRTFWPHLDEPMTRPFIRMLITTCNNWLDALCAEGALNGARAEILDDENSLTNLLQGIITLHVYNAPPIPAQAINFNLEFDVSYLEDTISI